MSHLPELLPWLAAAAVGITAGHFLRKLLDLLAELVAAQHETNRLLAAQLRATFAVNGGTAADVEAFIAELSSREARR